MICCRDAAVSNGACLAQSCVVMLSLARRLRLLLVRLGLGLIALASLAAVAVLMSNALLASSLPPSATWSAVAKDAKAQAKTVDLGVAEVAKPSSAVELASSIERAREQITSLVVNEAVDWSALIADHDTELVPTSLDDMDQLVLFAGLDPGAADSTPLASAIGQLARADSSTRGVMSSSGSGGWGGAGGGGGVSGTGGGGGGSSALAGGATGSYSGGFATGTRGGDNIQLALATPAGVERDARANAAANGNANGIANGNANGIANGNGNANGRATAPGLARGNGVATNVTSVPEPSTLMLMAAGLSSLAMSRMRRRAKN